MTSSREKLSGKELTVSKTAFLDNMILFLSNVAKNSKQSNEDFWSSHDII
jgi:hypothetical protein